MSALPLGRYRQLLHQLLQLNEQAAALRRELTAFVDNGVEEGDSNDAAEPGPSGEKINNNPTLELELNGAASSEIDDDLDSLLKNNPCEKRTFKDDNPKDCSDSLSDRADVCYKPNISDSKNVNKPKIYDLESVEDMDNKNHTPRKPHFLDEDYHLKSNDTCQILKPHFLDQSPSPEDDKVMNGHKFQDSQHSIPNGNDDAKYQRELFGYPVKIDANNGEGTSQDKSDIYTNSMLSSNTSNSSRYSNGFDNACFMERDPWQNQDSCSVKSFFSAGSENPVKMESSTQQQIGSKVDCVYSLLSLLSLSKDCNVDMSEYLLEMSKTIDSCIAMRQSGCIPLLVQLIHSKHSRISKNKASLALHNMVHMQPDNKAGRREVRVLRLLEQVRDYCYLLEDITSARKESNDEIKDDMAKHPVQSVAALMKLSFDEEHRHVMCQLGGLQSLASLVIVDQAAHGSLIEDTQCITMRKYSGMALTNLTFGDGNNKALLCSFKEFMVTLVEQLKSPNEDMRQVTAAILRNLSWRADSASKQILRDVGAVKGLTLAAMSGHQESTLKSVLSALWNLTAHCSLNKGDICSVDGALAFLVKMLTFEAPSQTLAIIENAGGILRNVSSHIAIREDYRKILRENNCLKILLQQLKSPSLTIVSNSCGTLWNLSARCQEDQQYLWDHGAVPMLRSLIHSKHKMIAMGSSAALKNLLNSIPGKNHIKLDATSRSLNLPLLPTLGVRKQKALEQEIDQNLSETCENIEPNTSPTTGHRDEKLLLSAAEKHLAMSIEKRKMSSSSPLIGHLNTQISLSQSVNLGFFQNSVNLLQGSTPKGHIFRTIKAGTVNRSDSKDSVTSTHSDSIFEINVRADKGPVFGKVVRKPEDRSNPMKMKLDYMKCPQSRNLMKYDHGPMSMIKGGNISRNNYSESGYDIENECCDQPIDYSQKYSEKNIANNARSPLFHIKTEMNSRAKSEEEQDTVVYGDYQETDLDQPTDYSLRYAEDNSDVVSTISEPQIASVHEDTIKHFCTEGTPYETPINFSTATSMSDLRAIGRIAPEINLKVKTVDSPPENKENVNIMVQSDERDTCSVEESAKHNNDEALNNPRLAENVNKPMPAFISKFSSGIASPEKPTNYCEEGTPGYFSRVSSLSSLGEMGEDMTAENVWNNDEPNANGKSFKSTSDSNESDEKQDAKVILENNANIVNYAEETPLMFSRSSSLGSLSECSVPDQADDIRSVVSEFSRLTSGCISPSELPDSPMQSPLPRIAETAKDSAQNQGTKPFKLQSVFEDEVSTFKFENTPIEFSTGTSLSSLTIDDEPGEKIQMEKSLKASRRNKMESPTTSPIKKPDFYTFDKTSLLNTPKSFTNRMEIKREKILAKMSNDSRMAPKTVETSLAPLLPETIANPKLSINTEALGDACHTYCTEDTPAVLSKACSQSDLSVLSISEMEDNVDSPLKINVSNNSKRDFSDDSSNTSNGQYEHLLNECIQSGMPKDNPMMYLLPRDEIENYAIEGSPFHHSLRSSLSDLTIASSTTEHKARLAKNLGPNKQGVRPLKHSPRQGSLTGSVSSTSLESEDGHILDMAIRAGMPQKTNDLYGNGVKIKNEEVDREDIGKEVGHFNLEDKSEEHVTVLTRNGSMSSSSVDSLGSNEGEQALFEQCIKSGMPKASNKWEGIHAKTLDKNFKSRLTNRKAGMLIKTDDDHDSVFEDLVTAGAFATCSRKHSKTEENLSDRSLLEEAIYCGMPKKKEKPDPDSLEARFDNIRLSDDENDAYYPKNVQGSSVVANHIQSAAITITDVKKKLDTINADVGERASDARPSSNGATSKNSQSNTARNGCDATRSAEDLTENQNSLKGEKDSDTWNENSYPIDVSFPSISGSLPFLTTFKSDNPDEITCGGLPDLLEESLIVSESMNCPDLTNKLEYAQHTLPEGEYPSLESVDTSTSNDTVKPVDPNAAIIEKEALQLAMMMKNNISDLSICLTESGNSLYSMDLDNINPPSRMNSLLSMTHSITENYDECRSENLVKKSIQNSYRKKSLPHGVILRKPDGSENISNILENINPPSEMDLIDMENSMLSVASIVSEIADPPAVETICEEMRNSDSDVSTDLNNFDIGLKKRNSLTPRQKRQLIKDRYKTYTIEPDTIVSNTNLESDHNETIIETANFNIQPEAKKEVRELRYRKSIKQRRLENSERFKTQTIERSISSSSDASSSDVMRGNEGTSDSFHTQIIKEATKAFEFLQKQPIDDASYIDLDCETISLVSEDDSELNSSRMRTLTKSFKNYLPVIESPTAVDRCIEENLKNMESFPVNGNEDADEANSVDFDGHSEDDHAETNQEKPKPIISKTPVIRSSSESINEVKGIRGRRKTLYVSPYKRTDSSPKKIVPKTNLAAKPTKANPIKTQKTDVKKPTGSITRNAPLASKTNAKNAIAAPKPKMEVKPTPLLVRQGTFTKEESVFPPTPDVNPIDTNANDIEKSRPNKNAKTNSNIPSSKLPKFSMGKASSVESNISSGKSSVKSGMKRPQKISYSSSNQSLQSSESSKTVKTNAKPENVNSSKVLIKDTASKVASLWKKVEQSRSNTKPSNKAWIAPDSSAGKSKLIRSSTFECSPKATSTIPVPLKQKSSITIRDSQTYKYASKVPVVKSKN